MKRKLYPNIKRMTSLFCVAIVCVTLTSLLLRLTVFSELAVTALAAPDETSLALSEEESGLFPYTISRKVNFDSPQSQGNFQIHNPETNEFYMTVTIIKPDTGENLLYTGFIKPGQSRDKAALHIQLPEGIYQCVAQVTAFDPETLEPSGNEERDITLYIGQKAKK